MKFTEKEISLARQLKRDGLIWHPQEGDWYFDGDVIFYTGAYDVIQNLDVWLPLWHQCREILDKLGIRILLGLSGGTGHRIIDFYRRERDNNKFLFTTTGNTDLEALYQGIGLLLVGGDRK